jgi:hypothetical protein
MSISYAWQVDQMFRGTTSGQVLKVRFTVTATSTNHSHSWSGTTNFIPDPSSSSFVSYDNLTEDIVLGWVKSSPQGIDTKEAAAHIVLALEEADDITEGVPWS